METVADFDVGIAYIPSKANVMADALSRKSYCNHLQVHKVQPSLVEEFRKLNLHIVPPGALAPPPLEFQKMNLRVDTKGSLNTLAVVLDLVAGIKTIQGYDSEVHKIKRHLAKLKALILHYHRRWRLVLQRPPSGTMFEEKPG